MKLAIAGSHACIEHEMHGKATLTIIASGFPGNRVDPNLAGMTITAESLLLEALCNMLRALTALDCPTLNLNLIVEQFTKFFTTLAIPSGESGRASKPGVSQVLAHFLRQPFFGRNDRWRESFCNWVNLKTCLRIRRAQFGHI
jgi:hypothetical protein